MMIMIIFDKHNYDGVNHNNHSNDWYDYLICIMIVMIIYSNDHYIYLWKLSLSLSLSLNLSLSLSSCHSIIASQIHRFNDIFARIIKMAPSLPWKLCYLFSPIYNFLINSSKLFFLYYFYTRLIYYI